MTHLDRELKSRDITLPTKICIVKAVVFPVVIYGCESWTIKKDKHWRIDAFELWCLRRPECSLDSKEIKQVNPKENQPWISIGRTAAEAEAPILWPPHVKNQLIGKDCDAGKDCRQKEKGVTEGVSITNSMDMNLSKLWEIVEDRGAWHAAFHEVTELDVRDWTTTATVNTLIWSCLSTCKVLEKKLQVGQTKQFANGYGYLSVELLNEYTSY